MSVRGFSNSTTFRDSPQRQATPSTSHGQLTASWLEGNKIDTTHPPSLPSTGTPSFSYRAGTTKCHGDERWVPSDIASWVNTASLVSCWCNKILVLCISSSILIVYFHNGNYRNLTWPWPWLLYELHALTLRKLCSLLTQCIYLFRMILTINSLSVQASDGRGTQGLFID